LGFDKKIIFTCYGSSCIQRETDTIVISQTRVDSDATLEIFRRNWTRTQL